jgi:hypothetical protein
MNDETRFLMLGEESVEYLSIKSWSFAPYNFGANLLWNLNKSALRNVLLATNFIANVALSNWYRMVEGAKMTTCLGQIGLFMLHKS